MSTLRGITLAGTDTLLDHAAVTAFQARLRGALLSPDDPPYEQARKVWNGMINKYPALIARCTGVADVVEAVQFANAHDLPVAIRCGSHNAAGHATCDGGLVLDLPPMKGMRVDPCQAPGPCPGWSCCGVNLIAKPKSTASARQVGP